MRKSPLFIAALLMITATSLGRAEMAKAMLKATTTSVGGDGTVNLEDTAEGLKVTVDITQAPPGKHAFHIHEFGSCDNEGKAAGSHYNPADHPHGQVMKDGVSKTHPGDFGNITVDAKGRGSLSVVVPGLTLTKGDYPVAGRAFILHEKVDDFSQPTGNAGGRIGCGSILLIGK